MKRFFLETERLVLREMNPDDFEALYAVLSDADNMKHYPYAFDEARVREWILSEDAYKIYASCMYEPAYEKYLETMKGLLKSPSVEIYIYRTGHYIAGMLVLDGKSGVAGLNQTDIGNASKAPDAEIIGIAVNPGCRHFGIGRKLLRKVTESGRFNSLYAQTDDDAVDFYRSCGFAVTAEVKQYPDGEVTRYHCLWKREKTQPEFLQKKYGDKGETK